MTKNLSCPDHSDNNIFELVKKLNGVVIHLI